MDLAGGLFLALGTIAILFPLFSGISAELFFGVVMIGGAGVHIVSLLARRGREHLTHIVFALLFLAMGLLLAFAPMLGLVSIALIVGVGFFIQGVVQITYGLSGYAREGSLAMGLGGLVGVLAGGAILLGWPFDSTWVFGVIVGANLIVFGLSLIMMRNVAPSQAL